MRVFVTGATGFVGSAVVQELLAAGHQVLALARSDAGIQAVAAAGAAVQHGDVTDPASLQAGARAADAVIHTAFIHEFHRFQECCEIDRAAIGALADALEGSSRPLIVTSGTGLVPSGRLATEDEPAAAGPHASPRLASEEAAEAARARGIDCSIMRLPPSVHGEGDHGFVPMLIAMAREKGVSAYVGEGRNVWSGVHRSDAARLYRLAIERRPGLPRYHASAEQGTPFKEIATVIGQRLDVPVVSKTPAEAAQHFGWFAHFAAMDNPNSSARTRAATGWDPTGPSLLADIAQDSYYR
jgi:nucleoside-diphosphate-sugar epimerase